MQSYALKFILVGDSGVGKSQLSRSFTRKTFKNDIQTTVGMEFATREIPFERSVIKAQIWDTAGMERFESMSKAYYRDAVGALLVYDVTNPASLERLKSVWLAQLKEYGHDKMAVMLVGNKSDRIAQTLDEGGEIVSVAEGIAFADAHNFDFTEASALTSANVELAFRRMILSVARKLPDIRVHLDLTELPDGWLRTPIQPQPIESSPENSSTDELDGRGRPQSQRLQLESVDGTEGQSPPQRTVPIRIPSQSELVASSSPDSLGSPRFSFSPRDDPVRRSITISRPKVIYLYTNYWTGVETMDIPTAPAPTGLLHEVERSTLGALALKENGPHNQEQDVDLIRNSTPTENNAFDTKYGGESPPTGRSAGRYRDDTSYNRGSAPGAGNQSTPGRNKSKTAGLGGSSGGISMRSNKVIDSDTASDSSSGHSGNHRCFCVIV